jgi:uncharacterized protein (DUF1499 family)
MTAVLLQRESKQARSSRRIAIFAAQIVLLSIVLHRFDLLDTPVATNLFAVGVLGGFFALVLAIFASVRIWRQGMLGGGHAAAGAIIGLALLLGPAWYLPDLLLKPKINDITTDFRSPPKFDKLAAMRGSNANPVKYPGNFVAEQQVDAYPEIRPMVLERSAEEAYDLVHEAVKRLAWQIVDERKPNAETPGRIEAVTRTLLMGYPDDISVRIMAEPGKARIDVRSASRYGSHDFGANASRVRRLFDEVKSGLEKGERQALDIALAERAKEAREKLRKLRELRAKAKKEEEERLTKLREEAREEELKRLSELQEEALRIELGLGPPDAPGEQGQTGRPRPRASGRDNYRFWQQFGE